MYRTTLDQNAPDATIPRIDEMLDQNPHATDLEIAKLLEIDRDFQEFFDMRKGATALGFHIESTGELASKVWARRMRRDLEKALGQPLPPSGPVDVRELPALLQKAVTQIVALDRHYRRLQAIAELRAFFTGRADLPRNRRWMGQAATNPD